MSETFASLGVPAPLVDVLQNDGKTAPFPIQAATLPASLAGTDVLGRGRTGSGKTIAFAIPVVARLAASGRRASAGRPRALILAPTRELATQIAATVSPLAEAVGLSVMTIFGGVGQRPQEEKLRRGTDIVVACPGRLEDLMGQGHAKLDGIEVTVLDEADHMADLGFLPGVTRIMAATPESGQRLLFSATLDGAIDKLVRRFLHNPAKVETDTLSVPAGDMTHRVLLLADADDKNGVVRELASGTGRRIMFTRTKHQAKRLAKQLTAAGVPAVDLQGNLSQNARERNLAAFGAEPEDGGVRVLVATDVAARGVHVDGVELVVHVDPPAEHKAYLHRSGRTARAGASGTVVTVVLPTQRREAQALLKAASIDVPFETVRGGDQTLAALVGDKAPHRMVPTTQQPSNGRNRPPKQKDQGQRSQAPNGQGGKKQSGGSAGSANGQGGRNGAQGGRSGAPGGRTQQRQGAAPSAQKHRSNQAGVRERTQNAGDTPARGNSRPTGSRRAQHSGGSTQRRDGSGGARNAR